MRRLVAPGLEVRGRRPTGKQQSGFARGFADHRQQPADDIGDAHHSLWSERGVRHCGNGLLDLTSFEVVLDRAPDLRPGLLPVPPHACRCLRQAEPRENSGRIIVARHRVPAAPGTLEMP